LDKFPLVALTPVLVWLLGSGIIGRDMSSGVSHLLFTRPITRASYILTKWLSLVFAVWAFQILVLVVWALGTFAYRSTPEFDYWTFKNLLVAMWMAATLSTVVILYSTIMPGWGDLALLFFVHVTVSVFSIAAQTNSFPFFKTFTLWLLKIAWPGLGPGTNFLEKSILDPGGFLLHTGLAIIYLLAALFLMTRKDITYTAE
jgi:ABC-type transport system involved in multi-copper enzyme maturation permease subunit